MTIPGYDAWKLDSPPEGEPQDAPVYVTVMLFMAMEDVAVGDTAAEVKRLEAALTKILRDNNALARAGYTFDGLESEV